MAEKKEKNTFRPLIEKANNELEQIGVCELAFETLRRHADPASFLEWFLEEADREWFKMDKTDGQKPSRLSDLLSMLETRPDEDGESKTLTEGRTIQMEDVFYWRARYTELVKGIIGVLSNCGLTVEEYYSELWAALCSVMKKSSSLEMGVCIYIILSDTRTPYYTVKQGLRMSNEQYREVIKRIKPELQKMSFVLSLNNSQKTETASQVLEILDGLKEEKDRVVFLSQCLTAYSKQGQKQDQ